MGEGDFMPIGRRRKKADPNHARKIREGGKLDPCVFCQTRARIHAAAELEGCIGWKVVVVVVAISEQCVRYEAKDTTGSDIFYAGKQTIVRCRHSAKTGRNM